MLRDFSFGLLLFFDAVQQDRYVGLAPSRPAPTVPWALGHDLIDQSLDLVVHSPSARRRWGLMAFTRATTSGGGWVPAFTAAL